MSARRRSFGARWFLVGLMAVVLLLGSAATAYGLSGRVTDEVGNGLAGIEVYVDRTDWSEAYHVTTNASGNYDTGLIVSGSYYVYFAAQQYNVDHGTQYVSEYYDDSYDWYTAGADAAATDVDASLSQGGSISGTVTGDGGPLEDLYVEVYDAATDNWRGGDWTDASGAYQITALPAGSYRVFFRAYDYNSSNSTYFLDEYYLNAADYYDATPVDVFASAATTDVDADLEIGASISGTVTGDGGTVEGIRVYVYGDEPWSWEAYAETGADGTYRVGPLRDDAWVVRFDPSGYNDGFGTAFLGEYYEDVLTYDDATPVVTVLGADTPGIDADLEVGGSISGTVTGDGGPLEGVWVELYNAALNESWSVSTAASGGYTADALPPGDYKIEFDPRDHNADNGTAFVHEYWEDVHSEYDVTLVTLDYEQAVNDVDADLEIGGTITGTVTGDGGPLEGVWVYAYDPMSDWGIGAYTDVDGTYEIAGLSSAEYEVRFDPWEHNSDNGTGFLPEYYDDVSDGGEATPVLVAFEELVSGIDADLEIGGSIAGTVTGDGAPLKGVMIEAYDDVTDRWYSTYTAADGTYEIDAMFPGEYVVDFDAWEYNNTHDTSFLEEYYDDARMWDEATLVPVDVAEHTPGIDADLEIGGTISGTVTGDGGPLDGVWIEAYSPELDYWASGYTDGGGDYVIRALPEGEYRVWFSTGEYNDMNDTAFLAEYYDDVRDADDATLVPVQLEQDTPGIDADLAVGGTISGTVTGAGDAPLEYVRVYVLDTQGDVLDSYRTESDGSWSLRALPPGEYRLAFMPAEHNSEFSQNYVREFWDDQSAIAAANVVTIEYGDVLTGYDAQLAQGGSSIGGTVYESDGATTVGGIYVSVYERLTDGTLLESGWAISEADDGTYVVHGLATGAYVVEFYDDMNGDYTIMLYDGVPEAMVEDDETSWAVLADPVNVVTGTPTTGIDALMQRPASVYGSVVDASGDPLPGIDVILWYNDADLGWVPVHEHGTDAGGMFDFEGGYCGLLPGEYRIQFVDASGELDDVWYPNAATPDAAEAFTVAEEDWIELDTQQMPALTGLTVTPVAGTNRVGTAIAASVLAFEDGSVETVVIATAMNWPDALGGASLAGAVGGPILLTNTNALPGEVLAEITRLGAEKAIILGGTSAVGGAVENALNAKLGAANVDRLAGGNRYETARMTAARCVDELESGGGFSGTAFLATGANFPDALGASPLAAANGWPIYLVNPAAGADATLVGAMKADGVDDVLVLGGTGVVAERVRTDVAAKLPASTQRLSGGNRYDTARAVATFGVNEAGLGWNKVALATGDNFPDALAGGVLQGKSSSVMMLTPSGSLNAGVASTLTANKAAIHEVRFLGGEGAVSKAVRTAVAKALQ